MKRSEINGLIKEASDAFATAGWTLPPSPRWDVTDFGLGEWTRYGLVLINLADEPEYCEKLMYARREMETPAHAHKKKKEDIIVRRGGLRIQLWRDEHLDTEGEVSYKLDGEADTAPSGKVFELSAGHRITLLPGTYHAFSPTWDGSVLGEVSTANDDLHDNFFVREQVGRYTHIDEDEAPLVRLISDRE